MERPDLDKLTSRPILDQVLKDPVHQVKTNRRSRLTLSCGGTQLGSKIALAVVRSRAGVKAFTENHSIEFFRKTTWSSSLAEDRGRDLRLRFPSLPTAR